MSNKQSSWDGLTGIFSLAFGLIYGFYAYNLPQPMFGNPLEAIFMPLAISIVAMIIGFLLIMKVGIRNTITSFQKLFLNARKQDSSKYKILYSCVISILYALLFEHIGYVLSTFLFMLRMLFLTCGRSAWKKNIVISILFSIAIYFIFSVLLSVHLPSLPLINE